MEDDHLSVQIQTKDAVLGVLKTNRHIRIPYEQVDEVRYDQKFFCGLIYLRVKDLALIDAIPGADAAEITLRVTRRDRKRASDFVHEMKFALP